MARRLAELRTTDDGFIFTQRNGNPINRRHLLEKVWKREILPNTPEVSHPHVTFHSFRHSSASHLLEAGWDIKLVQARGGWKDARVLLDTYAAVTRKRLTEAQRNTLASLYAPVPELEVVAS